MGILEPVTSAILFGSLLIPERHPSPYPLPSVNDRVLRLFNLEDWNMRNITMAVKNNILTITCDLEADKIPSSTGKTLIVASTEGNQKVPGSEFVLGLNLYTKNL